MVSTTRWNHIRSWSLNLRSENVLKQPLRGPFPTPKHILGRREESAVFVWLDRFDQFRSERWHWNGVRLKVLGLRPINNLFSGIPLIDAQPSDFFDALSSQHDDGFGIVLREHKPKPDNGVKREPNLPVNGFVGIRVEKFRRKMHI
jgi:hypothetical protein